LKRLAVAPDVEIADLIRTCCGSTDFQRGAMAFGMRRGSTGRVGDLLRHHVLRVNSRAVSRINSAPGMTSINANSKKEVMATKIMRG
jgi:hypothetical protein